MRKKKYWSLYDSLTKEEKLQFESWLAVELQGKQQDVMRMFRALEKATTEAEIWQMIHPDRPYNDVSLRQTAFRLSEKLSDYIAWQAIKSDDFIRDIFLLKGLNHRESGDLFPKTVKQIKKKFESNPRRDSKFYRAMYELYSEFKHYHIKISAKLDTHFQDQLLSDEALVHASFQEFILAGISQFYFGAQYNQQINIHFSQLITWLKDQYLPDDLVYSVTHQILRSLTETDGRLENDLDFELVQKDPSKFGDKDTFRNICHLVINILTAKANRSREEKNVRALYTFYQWAIESRWLFMGLNLPHVHFKNLIILSMKLGKRDRIKYCIEEYIPLLPFSLRDEMKAFSWALFHFVSGEYSRVFPLLNRKFTFPFDDFHAKFIILQVRYEQGDREDLIPQIRYFKNAALREKRINLKIKKSLNQTINAFHKLARAETTEDYSSLLKANEQNKLLFIDDWFRSKCMKHLNVEMKK